MKKTTVIPIAPQEIHLQQVELIQSRLEDMILSPTANPLFYVPSFNFQLRVDAETSLVRTHLELSVEIQNEAQVKQAGCAYTFAFLFWIERLAEFIQPQANEQRVLCNPQLARTLAGICFSTARGALWTQLQGTAFRYFILPIVHPDQLLQKAA